MSIKIHHGPPGSYKTSGAVMDDFVTAALAGRVVVTNVRGLNDRSKVIETLNKVRKFPRFWEFEQVPDSFDIVWIDTATRDGRIQLATFFHWIPQGAFLLIDEAQTVFPLAWKESQLKLLDYPDGLEAAKAAHRPPDFLTAFEMHRHYNWDMVLTTPNISKIRGDIRGCSEGAYKHKNQALLGIGGRYLEAFHLAEDNGKSNSDFLSVRGRKIKSYVWNLYASTATGEHSDTLAGSPLWKNPRVLLFVVLITGAIGFLSTRPTPTIAGGSPSAVAKQADSVGGAVPSAPVDSVSVGGVVSRQASSIPPVVNHPFSKHEWRMVGVTRVASKTKVFVNVSTDTEEINLSSDELQHYGYSVKYHDNCHADVSYKGSPPVPVYCHKKKSKVSAFDPKNPLPL